MAIKKIETSELRIGMYVHNLDCGWLDHPFMVSQFEVSGGRVIQKIASAGIRHVYIDTNLGKDVDDDFPELAEAPEFGKDQSADDLYEIGTSVPIALEMVRAKKIFREATSVVRNLMDDARAGKHIHAANLDAIAEKIIQSVFRNHHALTGVARIKTKDEYTFMHCVSFAGLLVTFGKELGFAKDKIHHLALGGLLHDVGKILTPQKILNKAGKLSDEEFAIMKEHVVHGQVILREAVDIPKIAMEVALQHHERMDGSGYPLGLTREKIGLYGKMAAIVDVYDALTSVRVYKEAWEPTAALKNLLEWSPNHFDSRLVRQFIKCLGIYPVGSLVQLKSGLVGLVLDLGEDMLRPHLRIIYHGEKRRYEKVRDMHLAKYQNDKIVKVVSAKDFNLDVTKFV